jgi:TolA-binding protein
VDSIISRQEQTEEKISEMENKIEELLNANNHKERKN